MDPLKPFTAIIRSAWSQSKRRVEDAPRTAATTPATEHSKYAQVAGAQPAQTLQGRLRMRLARLTQWDGASARQLFVECVLTSELGDDLANDPAFTEIAQRVSQQLGTDAALSGRLDKLLKSLAAGEAIA